MKNNLDIQIAEGSYIEMENGNIVDRKGFFTHKLVTSSDFHLTEFPFSVWEVTDNTYDWSTYAQNFACLLRANQSTLEGALKYMTAENRVLVWNKDIPEAEDISAPSVA